MKKPNTLKQARRPASGGKRAQAKICASGAALNYEAANVELQSSNQELTSVNQDLNQLNSDLNNLHASIQTPILVLGLDLTIRRFNPLAKKLFNLLPSDVDRPLSGIKHNLVFNELESFINEAIISSSPRECEVQDREGNWYILRVRPYLTLDNKIDGAVLMLINITALKQTEQQIKNTRDFAQAVIETVPPLLILEPDLRVRIANGSFYKTFEVTAEETEKHLIYELGNGQWNIPALRKLLEEILPRNSSFQQYEVTHDFEDLGRRTMLMSGRRVESMQAIVLFIEDITARKQALESSQQAKETLSQLNSDLNNLHASIQTPILVLGSDLTIRRFTLPAQKLFNLLAWDVGRPLSGIKHNLVFAELELFIAEAISSSSPRECEVQDREGNWYILRVRPYLTIDNKIEGAVLMLTDINALKQTEQQIKNTRDFAQAVIETVPPLLILEPDLRVRIANGSFYKTFGVTSEDTEKHLIYELGNGQWNIPALRKLLEEILPRNNSIDQYEVTHDFEDLGRRTMLMSGRKVESMQAIVLSIEDITVRKQAEEVTRRAKETLSRNAKDLENQVLERTAKLQEAIGELLHFSYTITHDMRAPLRAMQGYGDMLLAQETSLSESGRNYVARIGEAAKRMDNLITDALDYAKLSDQAFEIREVDAGALLRGMLRSYPDYQPSAAKISIADKMPPVLANEAGLTQCFSNLLDNAIKFVEPGKTPEVRIWAEIRTQKAKTTGQKGRNPESKDQNQQSVVRFWVEDNGIGIPAEYQDKVFGMFQRLSSQHEGTGIGLALARKSAQRMNGLVGFESEPGKGSRFWLEFKKASST